MHVHYRSEHLLESSRDSQSPKQARGNYATIKLALIAHFTLCRIATALNHIGLAGKWQAKGAFIAVKTTDKHGGPLKFTVVLRMVGQYVVADFRRIVGDGWEYKQRFVQLRAALKDLE